MKVYLSEYDDDATEAAWLLMHAYADIENAIDHIRASRKTGNRAMLRRLRTLRKQIAPVLNDCSKRKDIDFHCDHSLKVATG